MALCIRCFGDETSHWNENVLCCCKFSPDIMSFKKSLGKKMIVSNRLALAKDQNIFKY
jgi:hypothetical protein